MDITFRKQQRCTKCAEPLNQDDNWGCVHFFVPFFGMAQVQVEVHEHVHIGCVTGHMKWLALASLGRSRSEYN